MVRSKGIEISGIAACVPKNTEDNSLLSGLSERSKNEIIDSIGIRYRRVSNKNTCASDLCIESTKTLLKELDWSANDIGLVVFVTQTPDYQVPGSAAHIVHRLGFKKNILAIDVNQGCSGYVNGLAVATGLMQSFSIDKGLLLVGDTITNIISDEDYSLKPIFSDAGSATALKSGNSDSLFNYSMGSIGSKFKSIYQPHGGSREMISKNSLLKRKVSENIIRADADLAMMGTNVFAFGLTEIPSSIKQLLDENERAADSIDYLILHQANQLLSDLISKKAGFEKERTPSSLYHYGNTSCATIPVTMITQIQNELRKNKLSLLLSGFGVGLSWANVILETDCIVCPDILEL